jgi:hypothetical protein
MAEQLVQDVIGNLQGDYGIKRYLRDSFWAADYRTKLSPEDGQYRANDATPLLWTQANLKVALKMMADSLS